MSRITELSNDSLNADQRHVYDEIVSGPRGKVPAPLSIWLRRPKFASKAQALGQYCRYESSLPSRLSELAILTTAQIWDAKYEWTAHVEPARVAGISESIITSLKIKQDPDFKNYDERIVYLFTKKINLDKKISDKFFYEARKVLGEEGLVDLVGVLGYYSLISMTISTFEL